VEFALLVRSLAGAGKITFARFATLVRLTSFAIATATAAATTAATASAAITATHSVLGRAVAVTGVHRRLCIAGGFRDGSHSSCAGRLRIRGGSGLLFALALAIALALRLAVGFTLGVTLRITRLRFTLL
jgi:hypothetical protein